ncbi:hypothetical protein [Janthinobacterium sp. 64]|uniref:hypothetical protein n=1 Tax=Janthinobacterium sp. 64 TaxID=2035208 RepID=UPI000C2B5F2E|nr:hypothetical protein [Janthinobacterium sp. 64]PKB23841.1 hypothetical protein CLU91_4303 [Janthinobacterium sp. 64]
MTHKPNSIDRLYAKVFFAFRDRLGGKPVVPSPAMVPLTGAPLLVAPRDFEAEAGIYGNRYRGAFLLNFALGFAAVVLALVPLSGLLSQHMLHVLAIPLSILEISCIVAIMLIHWYGRDQLEHEGRVIRGLRALGLRNLSQGWRRRWGQARLAAEHVRYFDLMLGFPGKVLYADDILKGAGPDHAETATTLRALAERCPVAATNPAYVDAYRAHFLSVVRYQHAYHVNNSHRYHHIHHRVHTTATVCFYLTLAACGLHFFLHHPLLSVLAALFPALAATCHGILAAGEFNKLSEQSKNMVAALGELEKQVLATPAGMLGELEKQVAAFVQLIMQEAVGWHITLRDKDVQVV